VRDDPAAAGPCAERTSQKSSYREEVVSDPKTVTAREDRIPREGLTPALIYHIVLFVRPSRHSSHASNRQPGGGTGFTLVELLVVIAIIGILAALLAPGVGRMIDQTRSAKSLANKRQIYSAIALYHNDFNRLPSLIQVDQDSDAWNLDSGWHTIISPYLDHDEFIGGKRVGASEVSICPRADKHSKRGDYGIAYGQTRGPVRKETRNAAGEVVSSDLSLSFVQILNLGKTPLLADCEQLGAGSDVIGSWFFSTTLLSQPALSGSPRLSFRHDGKTQMVFCDGSIRSLTEEEVYSDVLPWKNEP
jgi:prepilin-type N-terminal cleavage/methylation domain-containing protein/prepilin-type processing-associated H-X9-DG protein